MKSLSKADEARRDQIKARLTNGEAAMVDAHADLIIAIGNYNRTVNDYNEALEEARGFVFDIANEIDSYMTEKSERWQEGDTGQAYQAWKDAWEALDLDDIEQMEEPEVPGFTHDSDLDDLPSEPELP